MNQHPVTQNPERTTRALLAVACAGLLLLGGCSAAPTATQSADKPSGTATARAGGNATARAGGNRVPGTFGLIADISGTTLQVQGSSGQTAVTYTDTTTITSQTAGSTADLTQGSCVSVRGAAASGTAATSITISSPVNGQCVNSPGGGFGGGGGTPPSGAPQGGMPSGAPEGGMPSGDPQGGRPSGDPQGGRPSGAPGGGQGGGVVGTVQSFANGTLTVAVTQGGSASDSTVTVADTTTITKSVTADAAALKVGTCAWANGTTDNTGAVAATSIRVSEAVNGACSMG